MSYFARAGAAIIVRCSKTSFLFPYGPDTGRPVFRIPENPSITAVGADDYIGPHAALPNSLPYGPDTGRPVFRIPEHISLYAVRAAAHGGPWYRRIPQYPIVTLL